MNDEGAWGEPTYCDLYVGELIAKRIEAERDKAPKSETRVTSRRSALTRAARIAREFRADDAGADEVAAALAPIAALVDDTDRNHMEDEAGAHVVYVWEVRAILADHIAAVAAHNAKVWAEGWQVGYDDYDQGTETPNPYRAEAVSTE